MADQHVDADADADADDQRSADEARQIYRKAISLLGYRDHCEAELRRKLDDRAFSAAAIDSVITRLQADGYMDDARYAHLFAEQRMARGYGPRAIQAKLSERGVDGSLCAEAIDALGVDWQMVATDALLKRFDADALADTSQRQGARVARFLQSRGFDGATALRAWQHVRDQLHVP